MDEQEIEKLITEEKERSKKLCEEALEDTPEEYRRFIAFIANNKKIGDAYVKVQNPYMMVAGRIKMAMDEHREKEATIETETWFEQEPVTGQVICKAKVVSSLLGSATAHARVFIDGSGANATNPMETGETGAIGRALGNLGYGLYGPGVASAEEMESALAAQAVQGERSSGGGGNMYRSGSGGQRPGAATEKQVSFLRSLLKDAGWGKEQIDKRVLNITREDASKLIELIKNDPQGAKNPKQSQQNGAAAQDEQADLEAEMAEDDIKF